MPLPGVSVAVRVCGELKGATSTGSENGSPQLRTSDSLRPGLYTCQINIVDAVASRFAFPRLELYVR